ncbi:MAG: hypothetical protein WBQ86_17300 [Candidatus Binatus sp.]
MNKYISRENRATVRAVLLQEWDPIGVRELGLPEDEYDAYVGKVYVMLMDEESKEAIAEYLLDIATRRMGLSDFDLSERSNRAAETLVGLRPSFRAN